MVNICYIVFASVSFALLRSKSSNFYVHFRLFCQTSIIGMLTCWGKCRNRLLVVLLWFLNAEELLTKLLMESVQAHAMQLLELALANFTRTRSVYPCSTVFICAGISNQRQVDSHLDKAQPVTLKLWSCFNSNEQDQIVKFRSSIQQAHRR